MRIPKNHFAFLAIGLAILLTGVTVPSESRAQDTRTDRHLAREVDPAAVRVATYAYQSAFPDTLKPDSTDFGTLAHFRRLYPDSYWESTIADMTNEDGTLAWLVTQDMLALIALYDHTKESAFLDPVFAYAEAAIQERDDNSGKKDEEGRSTPGWSTPRYGEKARRVYLVHSALIVQPILEWAVRVKEAPGWTESDEPRRMKLIEQCRETLLFHDYQLDPEPPTEELVYLAGREEGHRRHSWQPFNRQNLMARNFYLLYQLTGDEEYRERSEKLYRFFRNRLELTSSDAYVWEYEPFRHARGPVSVGVCDDVSHASHTLAPVFPACHENFVFSPEDLRRFARTFTKYVHLGDGIFQSKVGCQPTFQKLFMDRLYAWLPLAEADPQIHHLLRQFLLRNYEKPPALAIAYLIVHRPKGIGGIDTRAR